MTVLAQRFLFGILLLGGTLLLLWLDFAAGSTIGFLFLTLLFGGGGWWEFTRLAGLGGRPVVVVAGFGIVATGLVGTWLFRSARIPADGFVPFLTGLPLLFPLILLLGSLRIHPARARLAEIGLATLGSAYLVFPLICCLNLRFLPEGEAWVLMLVLVVKGNDIGGYLVGRKIGRTPLARVSPNKTIEGSLAGLAVGTAVAIGFSLGGLWTLGPAILIGLVAGVAGQAGDLAESFLKRCAGVKESGSIVPTFGGALDIMDSVLVAAPVIYFMALVVRG